MYDEIRAEIKRLRQEQGLTQTRLAELSGVERTAYNQIEGGHRNPSLDTLARLAAGLGVEVADFFPRAQPGLFDALARPASGAGQEAHTAGAAIPLELHHAMRGNHNQRRRAWEAATAAEREAYVASILAALGRAEVAVGQATNNGDRTGWMQYAFKLGQLHSEAEQFARQATHDAGVAASA